MCLLRADPSDRVCEDAAEAGVPVSGRPMAGLEVGDRAGAGRLHPPDDTATPGVRPSVPRPELAPDGELTRVEGIRGHVEVRAEERDDPILADRVQVDLVDDVEAVFDACTDWVRGVDARDAMRHLGRVAGGRPLLAVELAG